MWVCGGVGVWMLLRAGPSWGGGYSKKVRRFGVFEFPGPVWQLYCDPYAGGGTAKKCAVLG